MTKIPERLKDLIKDVGLTENKATWNCHGVPVVLHKALEKIASKHNIVFDAPNIIESNIKEKYVAICVTGHMGDATEWSIGEAAPYNTTNKYPYAMAEKRAKDRVILKLVGLHGDVYSEEEADDFKNQKPTNSEPNLSIDQAERIEAMLEFYEDCNLERFLAAEKKYEKVLNMVGIGEDDYNKIIEAHDKRKAELYS
tara:strand:+ start:2355 stop:2945 length:591 start_codon:yes stop_codon:yes gene_type:complete